MTTDVACPGSSRSSRVRAPSDVTIRSRTGSPGVQRGTESVTPVLNDGTSRGLALIVAPPAAAAGSSASRTAPGTIEASRGRTRRAYARSHNCRVTSQRSVAYGGDRPEVRHLVPAHARRVLDLGCSSGAVGAAMKRERDVEVVGVEPDPPSAAAARRQLDRVVEADAEELLGRPDARAELGGPFDCLLAADTLEHLRDPWTALARAAELLEPGATAVVSLPNVRFFETFW